MPDNPNVALVKKMYDCFDRRDMDALRKDVFADDLIWRLPGRHPLAGVKHGPAEVIAFFGQLARFGVQVDIQRIDVYGEDTVVEVHRGHAKANGAVLDAVNCTHYKIVNGKIADVQVYLSDQYGADDFFSALYQLKPIPERLAL